MVEMYWNYILKECSIADVGPHCGKSHETFFTRSISGIILRDPKRGGHYLAGELSMEASKY